LFSESSAARSLGGIARATVRSKFLGNVITVGAMINIDSQIMMVVVLKVSKHGPRVVQFGVSSHSALRSEVKTKCTSGP